VSKSYVAGGATKYKGLPSSRCRLPKALKVRRIESTTQTVRTFDQILPNWLVFAEPRTEMSESVLLRRERKARGKDCTSGSARVCQFDDITTLGSQTFISHGSLLCLQNNKPRCNQLVNQKCHETTNLIGVYWFTVIHFPQHQLFMSITVNTLKYSSDIYRCQLPGSVGTDDANQQRGTYIVSWSVR
jgi:hypothetical protein